MPEKDNNPNDPVFYHSKHVFVAKFSQYNCKPKQTTRTFTINSQPKNGAVLF